MSTSTAAAVRTIESRPPGVPAPATSAWRVMLAEDVHEMRTLLADALTSDGYEVITARDGSELIRHLQEVATQPHGRDSLAVVISDVRMPHFDGLDVLAALRCAHWYTPVILITAFGDDATHHDAHEFGAVAVLEKPFSLSSLLSLVHQIAPPSIPSHPTPSMTTRINDLPPE